MTLQELRKAKFKTIRLFAMAYGKSDSVCSDVLKGKHHRTLRKEDVQHLADVLGVSFEECVRACDETYEQWKQTPLSFMLNGHLYERWAWEEYLLNAAQRAKETGNWEPFRRATGNGWGHTDDGATWTHVGGSATLALSPTQAAFHLLNLPMTATQMQIKQAFRCKVKSLADGKGGYKADMDKLVQAKEAALRHAGERL